MVGQDDLGSYNISVLSDDFGESIETAGNYTIGTTLTGAIESYYDEDWLLVPVVAGEAYRFNAVDENGNTVDLDYLGGVSGYSPDSHYYSGSMTFIAH